MIDSTVNIAGLELKNPVLTASGTFGSGQEFSHYVDLARLGALVTKGVSLHPWDGNASPRMAETASGMLNSIGLQNPGVDVFIRKDLAWLRANAPATPVIVNVSGHNVAEYAAVVERLEMHEGVSAYELNISCPNVDTGGMAFGTSCSAAGTVVSSCRSLTKKPLIVKLSPNVTDIAEIARAVVAAGADSVSLINTVLGMAVDIDSRRPKLARVVGGLSGPAIKPIALRMVWQVASAVDVPVIGMGGILTARDAIEFMMAGASCVAVGTANIVDPTSCTRIVDGIEQWCVSHGISQVKDLTGSLEVDA